jgi:2-oxoglutarate ferredoxin oxidoreductase subunit delta
MTDSTVQESLTEKPARKPKEARGRVTIFGLWCKGCRLCVEFCPAGVLAFNEEDRPVVAHPEKCSACHWCDMHCPDLAIVVTNL